jgi:hypothetical protein
MAGSNPACNAERPAKSATLSRGRCSCLKIGNKEIVDTKKEKEKKTLLGDLHKVVMI